MHVSEAVSLLNRLIWLILLAFSMSHYLELAIPVLITLWLGLLLFGMFVVWRYLRARKAQKRITYSVLGKEFVLPLVNYSQPMIVVTGDGLSELFGDNNCIERPDGCYLRVDDTEQLHDTVRALLNAQPYWASQLSVMHVLVPENHLDQANLRVGLKRWRWQIAKIRQQLGVNPHVLITSYFDLGNIVLPHHSENPRYSVLSSPWFCQFTGTGESSINFMNKVPTTEVRTSQHIRHALSTWLSSKESIYQSGERYAYALFVKAAQRFLIESILIECWQSDRLAKTIMPFALSVHFAPLIAIRGNVWAKWLTNATGLNVQTDHSVSVNTRSLDSKQRPTLPLADVLLTSLPHHQAIQPIESATYSILFAKLLFIASGISASYQYNKQLIATVDMHLRHYYEIEMGNGPAKSDALMLLKQDAALLELYYRQAPPLRYRFGLYRGLELHPVIISAIRSYIPPAKSEPAAMLIHDPTVQKVEEHEVVLERKQINLDSLSLFDVGKSVLKPEATQALIRAVVDIKTQPGYVILITGHTDNKGNEKQNSLLSLKRAEAVRDWMMDASDLPISCFAVQGYGSSQPIAPNDTDSGRQLNRRVEISLVPNSNDCRHESEASTLLLDTNQSN